MNECHHYHNPAMSLQYVAINRVYEIDEAD